MSTMLGKFIVGYWYLLIYGSTETAIEKEAANA
jgi:hypothetical protein